MIMSDVNLISYSDTSYPNEELKSLTRYCFDKMKEQAKLKYAVSKLMCIPFPELEKLMPTRHITSVYALLSRFPSVNAIAAVPLTKLTNLFSKSSISSHVPTESLELKHTIKLIRELAAEIVGIETSIKSIIDEIGSPILTILDISYRMGAMIIAEIGDFSHFDSSDKILAYAGMSPSTYQSGQPYNKVA